MGQDCARWHDDLGSYILGALDAEHSAAMRGHLTDCPACRADHEYLLPVRDWLASTRQHLAACRACRADYQKLLHLRALPTSPQTMDLGDAPAPSMPDHSPRRGRPDVVFVSARTRLLRWRW
jgi:anti-sigma factor RsiW